MIDWSTLSNQISFMYLTLYNAYNDVVRDNYMFIRNEFNN